MNDREPCACGAPTPVGKWRCSACQARAEHDPQRIAPKLDDRPVQ